VAMGMRNRGITVLVAASYLLAITATARFHNHGAEGGADCCGRCLSHLPAGGDEASSGRLGATDEDRSHSESPAPCSPDTHECPVCQFLAQQPAPAAEVALVDSSELVQEVASAAPVSVVRGVFAAWHSRAPPTFA
jgi:hypothetical protein